MANLFKKKIIYNYFVIYVNVSNNYRKVGCLKKKLLIIVVYCKAKKSCTIKTSYAQL